MRRLSLSLFSIAIALGLLVAPLAPVYANDFNAACQGGGGSSAFCSSSGGTGDPLTGTDGVIAKVTRVVAIFAGVAAVIIMIIGGFMYVTSGGDSGKVSRAKDTIIYAAIGLLVIAAGQAIIAFVVAKL